MLLGLFVFLLACLHYISLIYFQCDEVTEDCQESMCYNISTSNVRHNKDKMNK